MRRTIELTRRNRRIIWTLVVFTLMLGGYLGYLIADHVPGPAADFVLILQIGLLVSLIVSMRRNKRER